MGKLFAVIFICGSLFLRIAEKIAKIEKLEPAKISCHTVDYFRVGLCILVFNKVYPPCVKLSVNAEVAVTVSETNFKIK